MFHYDISLIVKRSHVMRSFRILLAAWFALTTSLAFANTNDAQETLLLRSVRFYNSFKSTGHLINLMKANASEEDRKFLETALDADSLKKAPPEAAVKGNQLYVTGLKKPIEILDIGAGKFSYENRRFTIDYKGGLAKSLQDMENAIFPRKVSLFDFFVPPAHAVTSSQKQMLTMTMGLMGIMGLMSCFMQMSQNGGQMPAPPPAPAPPPPQYVQLQNGQIAQIQQPQQGPQMNSCGMAVFGLLGMLMAMGIDPSDKPQEIRCSVDMNGTRTLAIHGMGGAPLTAPYVQQPGKPIIFPPTMTGSQMAAGSHINQFCMNPMALQAANQALQSPYTIPPAPVFAPPGKPQVVTTQSVDDRKPSAEEPKEGTSGFMPPGTAGSR